jgi:hypothetical protein
MTRHHEAETVRPIDFEMGGDDDMPGIAQELTTDDVDDVAFDASLSAGARREQLMIMLSEVRSRQTTDWMGDMDEIASHLNDRIASLGNSVESQAMLESTGMDPDSRSDDDDPADHIDDDLLEEDDA